MAGISFAMTRNGGALDTLADGAQAVTQGTVAPGVAGTIQVSIDDTVPWTKLEVDRALQNITDFIRSTATTPII